MQRETYRSHAMWAQADGRDISSSALRVLARLRDWASSEVASSVSGGGRAELCVGRRESSACSRERFIVVDGPSKRP